MKDSLISFVANDLAATLNKVDASSLHPMTLEKHFPEIIEFAGDDTSSIDVAYLNGSIARKSASTYSDVDIEAYSFTSNERRDVALHWSGFLITYFRFPIAEIFDEFEQVEKHYWHRGIFADNYLLFGSPTVDLLIRNQLELGKERVIVIRPSWLESKIRQLLELRRKFLSASDLSNWSLGACTLISDFVVVFSISLLIALDNPLVSQSSIFLDVHRFVKGSDAEKHFLFLNSNFKKDSNEVIESMGYLCLYLSNIVEDALRWN